MDSTDGRGGRGLIKTIWSADLILHLESCQRFAVTLVANPVIVLPSHLDSFVEFSSASLDPVALFCPHTENLEWKFHRVELDWGL